jgi:protein-tyrosine-phosphatase/DNA-binding transcriptional ArsR family regulator
MDKSLALPQVQPPALLKLLADDLRWKVLTALVYSDRRGRELVSLIDEPQNLVSYHLKKLREGELVHERRSSYDGRDVYYSLDLAKLQTLYSAAGEALHPALSQASSATAESQATADTKGDGEGDDLPPARVLFLCTHNSARSQMAEAIMRQMGGPMVEVYSAGTEPSSIHPNAVAVLASMNIDASAARSKHLDEYADQRFDYIVTVCDRVREACPVFPGDPEQIHWSFPDPAAVEGEEEKYRAFAKTAQELTTRVRFLLNVIANERRGKAEQPRTAQ